MAKVWYNPAIAQIRGKSGDQVYRRMPDGSTCISKKHDFSHRTFSQGQKEHQSRFREATRYASEAAKSQPLYAQVAKKKKLTPYNVALADWFHGPEIRKIEQKEGVVRIWAMDNVMVARVSMTILDEEGVIRERGEGKREEGEGVGGQGGWWEYRPCAAGKVMVEAWDLAGNSTHFVIG